MSSWPALSLQDALIDVRAGFACGEHVPDGMFQFRMNNVSVTGELDFSRKRRVPLTSRNINEFLLKPGDVLFNATNSPELVGKTGFVPELNEPAVFSNHFFRLRCHPDKLDGRFLSRWLIQQFKRGVFRGLCRQWVNQAAIGRDALLALALPVPPLAEQRRIADILDRADALRAKRRVALVLLDTLAQSIFLDLFGDPASNPKRWPIHSIADACTLIVDCVNRTAPVVEGPTPFRMFEQRTLEMVWLT
jgi:type I restriction enzyme, S subunit